MKKYSDKEMRAIMNKANPFEWLTIKQMFTLLWWALFNRKKLNTFVFKLDIGMHAMAAFNDAKSQK